MIREHDVVILNDDIKEYDLAKGSYGTIVHCYEGGKVFEVEFIEPPHVLMLNAVDIKLDKTYIQSQVIESMEQLPEESVVALRDFANSVKQKYLIEMN